MQGWIKLHRKIIDNPIIKNPELLQLFIYCLLKANHESIKTIFNGKEIIVQAGQFITGRDVLANDLNQKGRTIYDRLKILKKLKFINIETNNKFTLVTVTNYALYQLQHNETNSKTNNKPTTNQQQTNTNKNDKNYKNIDGGGERTHANNTDFEIIQEKYFMCFGKTINSVAVQDIDYYLANNVDAALIVETLCDAARANARSWKYAKVIIDNCITDKVLTLEQYRKRRLDFESRTVGSHAVAKKTKSISQHVNFKQRDYESSEYDALFTDLTKGGDP